MMTVFAIKLLQEVADECDKHLAGDILFSEASVKLTEIIEKLVEEDVNRPSDT
jgi:hypothetical protein